MSIETNASLGEMNDKDIRRLGFQRGDRVQNHGVAANTYERRDPDYQDSMHRARTNLARRILKDELDGLSPSRLEKEADRLLNLADAENTDIVEQNDQYGTWQDEVEDDNQGNEDEKALTHYGKPELADTRNTTRNAPKSSLAHEMAVRRQMRGRRGSTLSPDYLCNGSHGEDEDLGDTASPLGGYLIR